MRYIEIHDSIDIHVCIHINFMSQLILLVREGRIDERNLCGFDLRDDLNYPGLWWSVSKQSGYHSIDYKESGGRGVERWVGCGAVWENFFEVQRCGSRIFCRGIVRRPKKKTLPKLTFFYTAKCPTAKNPRTQRYVGSGINRTILDLKDVIWTQEIDARRESMHFQNQAISSRITTSAVNRSLWTPRERCAGLSGYDFQTH